MENLHQHFRISRLIVSSFQKGLTLEEQKELNAWLENPTNQAFYDSLYNKYIQNKIHTSERPIINKDANWKKIETRIPFKKHYSIQRWMKYAAILTLPVILTILLLTHQEPTTSSLPLTAVKIPQPGSSKAVLLLANGQQVDLTQQQELSHPIDTTITLNNQNNTLTIELSGTKHAKQTDYQTIFIPVGGEYKLVLADGTKVWLNSDTRLRFPSTFTGNTREVYLEGEAYFEVAPNKAHSFIVKTTPMEIEVLGTKFNVKAYPADSDIYTTLAEGSVKTRTQTIGEACVLIPNQQNQYSKTTGQMTTKKVDAQTFIGWTKGVFIFENETLEEIMKQLGRWYGTQTIYQNQALKEYRFTGYVNRFDNISTILKMIEKSYNIKFNIQGNSIIVNN